MPQPDAGLPYPAQPGGLGFDVSGCPRTGSFSFAYSLFLDVARQFNSVYKCVFYYYVFTGFCCSFTCPQNNQGLCTYFSLLVEC